MSGPTLFDQALAETQSSAPKKGIFRDLVVDTGLADSMLWCAIGVAIGKFLL